MIFGVEIVFYNESWVWRVCVREKMMQMASTLPTSQRPLPCYRALGLVPSFPSSINFNFNPSLTITSSTTTPPPKHFRTTSTASATPTQEVVVVDNNKDKNELESEGFVDIGYISSIHGLQGEIRVKPTTDFPQLRFSTPGTRYLKQKVLGGETIQEVELEQGRHHPAMQSWILKFKGIDTVEQAKMLIGATLLVTQHDRPELEEGEFYTRDLVGIKVFLKVPSYSLSFCFIFLLN